jgi:hypothetical protein
MRVIIDGCDFGDLSEEFGIYGKLGYCDANHREKQKRAGE